MGLDDTIAMMSRAPLFELLDREAIRLLAFAAETRTLRPGDVLFSQGEATDGGYLVLRGTLALDGEGGPASAGPGDVVGRAALFAPTRRPVTATTREAATVLRVPHALMRRVLEEFPSAAAAIREAMAADLLDLQARLSAVEARFRPEG